MKTEIDSYVSSCIACQKHARVTKLDRIPIIPMVRADAPFDQVFVDLIGPLNPASSRGHTHVLTLVDSCTRWPEAVPLRRIAAKDICEALIGIFCRVGIPRILVSDNATNMTSQLNTELYDRLGVTLRTSTPYHPQGNSVVERFNATLKRMIHHVHVSDHPRDWDRQLQYMLWTHTSWCTAGWQGGPLAY